MKILVTGGAGFLGRHIVARLRSTGSDVFVPRRSEYDLRTEEGVDRLFASYTPDIVIHAAAKVGGIEANRLYPAEFFYQNAMMGMLVIDRAYRAGAQKCVVIGSVCSYPLRCHVPTSESSLWEGYPELTNGPYGMAKKMLLVQGRAYRQQYGFPVVHLLMANLYGPHDNFDPAESHVIPALIRKVATAKLEQRPEIIVWGTGTPTRSFLYVEDAAEAVCLACTLYDGEEPVNISSSEEISIAGLARKVCAAVGYNGTLIFDISKPDGQPRRCFDTKWAKNLFGFTAKTSFDEGLA